MIKVLRNIAKILITALFVVGVTFVSLTLINKLNEYQSPEPDKPIIIVDEEINLVVGEEYQLTPYVKNGLQEIEYGQYSYSTDRDEITISETGKIKAKKKTTSDVIVTINEINMKISKDIKIKVTEGLGTIFDITNSGSGNVLIKDLLKYNVTMLPPKADLSKYITFETIDESGAKYDNVLDLSIADNVLYFKAVGLGTGKLIISINSEEDNVHYTDDFAFSISLKNTTLVKDVLGDNTLLSASDLNLIENITYTGDELDVKDCSFLPNLKNIYFDKADSIPALTNISKNYTYFFKEEVYKKVYFDEKYKIINDNIEPFVKEDEEERFVIYLSKFTEKISIEKIHSNFNLKELETTGYTHNGEWSFTEDGTVPVTKKQVIASEKKSVRLYAIWTPIKYNIEYHSSFGSYIFSDGFPFETIKYGEEHTVLDFKEFNNINELKRVGYKFLGWTLNNVADTQIVHNAEEIANVNLIKPNEKISNLTDVSNESIKLYDVWEPIKYELKYSMQANIEGTNDTITLYEHELSKKLEILKYQYDEKITIETFTIVGFDLINFVDSKGNTYNCGQVVDTPFTDNDGVIIILTPVVKEKIYEITFDNQSITEIDSLDGTIFPESKVLTYTKKFNFPKLKIIASGIKTFYWYLDQNNNNLQGSNEFIYNPNILSYDLSLRYLNELIKNNDNIDNINSLSADKIHFYAKTTKISYDALFNSPDVNIIGNSGEKVKNVTTINDSTSVVISDVFKTGYTFNGWNIKVNDKTPINIKDKKITISQAGVFANGKLVAKTDNTTTNISFTPLMQANVTRVNFKHESTSTKPFVSINAVYDSKVKNVPNDPTKVGYNFMGWSFEGTTSKVDLTKIWNIDKPEVTLYGMFEKKTFTFNFVGGTVTNNEQIKEYKFEEKLPTPSPKTGFTFKGWNYNGTILNSVQDFNTTGKVTLIAEWQRNSYIVLFRHFYDYDVTFTVKYPDGNTTKEIRVHESDDGKHSDQNLYYYIDKNRVEAIDKTRYNTNPYNYYKIYIPYGSLINVTSARAYESDDKGWRFNKCDRNSIDSVVLGSRFYMPASDINLSADSNKGCVFSDANVLMSNGTTRHIEDLKLGDMVKTWSFEDGKYVDRPIVYFERFNDWTVYEVTLKFNDGTTIRLADHQSFFDLDKLNYVCISNENASEFIGTRLMFNENGKVKAKTIVDTNVNIIVEDVYEIFTAYDYNFIYDGILSVEPLVHTQTFFKVNADLKYDESLMKADIEKYGLFKPEEWSEYLTAEEFELVNCKYFKVAIGKGYMSEEYFIDLMKIFNYHEH